ncbi:MAG: AAA family ATPase [Candidatus Tumulicola sp.]
MSAPKFDVVGAEGPKRYFGALTRETLAHAYLFSGPAGVGKKTFARRLAQSLLCDAVKDGVLGYDGTCVSCVLFGAGENARHPDFIEHDGALKIGEPGVATGFYESVDMTSRDVVHLFSMQSYVGGMRALLLGDVDFASPAAANALLKFLEEPPSGVLMILTTATPGRLLETIRSRLIDVRFPLLPKPAVRDVLGRLGYGEADAELGSSLGEGSVTRAVAALGGEEESLRAQVAGWFFESLAGGTPERSWATRETLDEGLDTIKTLVRDWIVCGSAGDGSIQPISIDYAERLRRLPPLPARKAVELLAKLNDAARLARTNVNAAMVGEIVRMALTKSA